MKTLPLDAGQTAFQDLLSWAARELWLLGPREARENAKRLLEEVSGCGRFEFSLEPNRTLSPDRTEKFRQFVAQRKTRLPLAYVTGKAYFWNEVLEVSRACLIPRPETEILVETFLKKAGFEPGDDFSFLDLGSGSGAIGIALLRAFPRARGTFSDISEEALEITRRNLIRYGLAGRAELVQSDLFREFPKPARWDAVCSNPPYLAERDWQEVEPEILYEPREALDGGKDGLDFYRRILDKVHEFLNLRGRLMLEVGIGQAREVVGLAEKTGRFDPPEVIPDYAGIERVVMTRLRA